MSPEAIFWAIALGCYQVAIVLFPHPEEIEHPGIRALVRLLGRFSLLTHQSAPGTFHLPLTRQPWWYSGRRDELQRLPVPPRPPLVVLAALTFGLALPACSAQLTRARYVTAQGLHDQKGLLSDLKSFAATQEDQIATTSKTQEEARARLDSFRLAVDFATKTIDRAGQALRDVGVALGVQPAPVAP